MGGTERGPATCRGSRAAWEAQTAAWDWPCHVVLIAPNISTSFSQIDKRRHQWGSTEKRSGEGAPKWWPTLFIGLINGLINRLCDVASWQITTRQPGSFSLDALNGPLPCATCNKRLFIDLTTSHVTSYFAVWPWWAASPPGWDLRQLFKLWNNLPNENNSTNVPCGRRKCSPRRLGTGGLHSAGGSRRVDRCSITELTSRADFIQSFPYKKE